MRRHLSTLAREYHYLALNLATLAGTRKADTILPPEPQIYKQRYSNGRLFVPCYGYDLSWKVTLLVFISYPVSIRRYTVTQSDSVGSKHPHFHCENKQNSREDVFV